MRKLSSSRHCRALLAAILFVAALLVSAPSFAHAARPYADSSPFNTPIPSGAPTYVHSRAMVAKLTKTGPPDSLVTVAGNRASLSADYSRPIFTARSSDPVYTVTCTDYGGGCPISGKRVRIPARARPAAGTDGHMTVLDRAADTEWSFFRVQNKPTTGGTLKVGWGRTCRLSGDGRQCGGGAAEFGGAAGRIRFRELMTAIRRRSSLPHALFMTVACAKPGAFVYPATKGEPQRNCDDTSNAPEMGRHFQLRMSRKEIDVLPIPEWRKVIARTMAKFGAYVGDQGGLSWGLQFESGMGYLSFGRPNPFVTFAEAHPAGVVHAGGVYYFKLRDGIPWSSRLRVVDPSVSARASRTG